MSSEGETDKKPETRWYCQRSFVLLNLFFVLGPLALPLLFRSRDFSGREKAVYGSVITLLTAAFIAGIIIIAKIMWDHLKVINQALKEAF